MRTSAVGLSRLSQRSSYLFKKYLPTSYKLFFSSNLIAWELSMWGINLFPLRGFFLLWGSPYVLYIFESSLEGFLENSERSITECMRGRNDVLAHPVNMSIPLIYCCVNFEASNDSFILLTILWVINLKRTQLDSSPVHVVSARVRRSISKMASLFPCLGSISPPGVSSSRASPCGLGLIPPQDTSLLTWQLKTPKASVLRGQDRS